MGNHNFDNTGEHADAHSDGIAPNGACAICGAAVIADLRRQLGEANTAATMYKAMVCSQSCKMCFPPPDGEPLPWDELKRERDEARAVVKEMLPTTLGPHYTYWKDRLGRLATEGEGDG